MTAPGISLFAAALLAAAGAAGAQTALPSPSAPTPFQPSAVLAAASLDRLAVPSRPPPDLSAARPAFAHPRSAAETGFPQNSVDHAFSPQALGQVGYLCGLQPGPNADAGPLSSVEPVGTFLGAKLSLAF